MQITFGAKKLVKQERSNQLPVLLKIRFKKIGRKIASVQFSVVNAFWAEKSGGCINQPIFYFIHFLKSLTPSFRMLVPTLELGKYEAHCTNLIGERMNLTRRT